MIVARYGHTATALPDGTVLVTGGSGDTSALASSESFDPDATSWTDAGAMIEARNGPTATLLPDGTVLVVGGVNASGALASSDLYDPASAP
jgi:hypothetical protein